MQTNKNQPEESLSQENEDHYYVKARRMKIITNWDIDDICSLDREIAFHERLLKLYHYSDRAKMLATIEDTIKELNKQRDELIERCGICQHQEASETDGLKQDQKSKNEEKSQIYL